MQFTKLIDALVKDSQLPIIVTTPPQAAGSISILTVNQSFCEMTGYSTEELIGANPSMLQGERSNRPALQRLTRAVGEGSVARLTIVNYTKTGRRYLCDIEAHPLFFNDHLMAAIGFQREILARRGRFAAQTNRPSVLLDWLPSLAADAEILTIGSS